MAGPESAGAIYYTVDADTGKLLDSSAQVDKALDKTQKSFDKTDKAAAATQVQLTKTAGAAKELVRQVEAAQNPLGNLTRLIGGLVTLQGATALLQMAEAYGSMAERVKMAAGSQAEYEQVQQRLLATANGTYRALSEAQEVFIATGENLRDLGYTLDQALDIADSLSYAFVANATTADRANGALRAYDMALNKGKVEADGFITIIGAIPTIAGDIGRAIGKSAQEVRELGASGKLTAAQLNEGLRTSLDKNKTAADAMAVSVKDAFVQLKNNIAAYVGEANEATGVTGTMAKAVLQLGNNIDVIAKALLAIGAGALAKYVTGLIASTVASAQASIAARVQAAATLQQAQAHAAATAATAAQAVAMVGLTTTSTAAAAATTAAAAAQASLAAAQSAATASGVGLLAILGGPAGIIALLATAAVGIYAFGSNASSAVPKVDQLTDSIDKLNAAQLEQRKLKAADAIQTMTKEAIAANAAVKGLEKDFTALNEQLKSGRGGVTDEGVKNVHRALVDARVESDTATKSLQSFIDAEAKLNKEQQARTTRPTQAAPGAPKAQQDPDVKKRLEGMKEELALAKLTGEARAKLQAIQKLGANATAEERAEAEKLASQIYSLEEGQKRAASASKAAGKEAATAAQENAKTIKGMREELDMAALSGDALAAAQARAKLNKFATPEDVKTVQQLGVELDRVADTQKNKDAIQELGQQYALAGLKGLELAKANAAARLTPAATAEDVRIATELAAAIYKVQQAQAIGKDVTGFITGGQLGGDVTNAETEAEMARYAGQLERLKEAKEAQLEVLGGYQALEAQMARDHAANLVAIQNKQFETQLASASGAFGQLANAAKNYAGEQSGIYKAMFAVSKAFAIAQSIVAIQTGIAQAAALPFPANLGAMASVAAATAGIVSTITSTNVSGRQNGGPTQAGQMYRINESGAPEVYQSANGRQYMMANTRGEVISNKDATNGTQAAAATVIVQLFEDGSGGGQVTQSTGPNGESVVAIVVADIRSGGAISQTMGRTFGLGRKGN